MTFNRIPQIPGAENSELVAWAGVDTATRAAHPLVVQCHMDPATRAAWEDRRDGLGLAETVRFTGEVTDDELVRLMQTAALVVFPSLYEGLGLPVLEARRCGAPVVCGDNSSLRELVADPRCPTCSGGTNTPPTAARKSWHRQRSEFRYLGPAKCWSRWPTPGSTSWTSTRAAVSTRERATTRHRFP